MASKDLQRWGDLQQYVSEPMPPEVRESGRPKVTLLNATPDPLGSVAALCGIYTGKVVRSLADVSDDERRSVFEDMQKTALNGPLEAVQFHFLIEGVDRSFTHQAVRGRAAFYAQESLRFAVPVEEDWQERVSYPPSLAATPPAYDSWERLPEADRDYILKRDVWDDAVMRIHHAYSRLVNSGIPAEDARGLLPHAIQTRYHWICDLRELLHVAGLRTCTQAQFHWRLVMAEVARCLREYANRTEGLPEGWTVGGPDAWQWELIADQIRPVCYQTGRCGFMAKFDRNCSIRERVEKNARAGRESEEWHEPLMVKRCRADANCDGNCEESEIITVIPAIRPQEWAADPGAAR